MADFRNTTNEFKSTWEKEVNFEEEEKALRTGELSDAPVARITPALEDESKSVSLPEVKEIDKAAFDDIVAERSSDLEDIAKYDAVQKDEAANKEEQENEPLSDKRRWL